MIGIDLFSAELKVAREPHERGAKDDFGKKQDVYGEPVDVLVYSFDPGGSSVVYDGGYERRVVTTPTLYAPVGVALADEDRVTVPGHGTFIVDGIPARWSHPALGAPTGAVVMLRRVDG
ncbi:MAG: hypothetical protein J7474_04720 [Arthrobacter sp.]|nr:hypothetical protein [Arthrobacter sp.]